MWSQNLVRPLTYIHAIHIAYITMLKLNTWYDVRPAWCVYFVGLATLLDERYAKSFQKRISSNRKRVTSCMTKIYRLPVHLSYIKKVQQQNLQHQKSPAAKSPTSKKSSSIFYIHVSAYTRECLYTLVPIHVSAYTCEC